MKYFILGSLIAGSFSQRAHANPESSNFTQQAQSISKLRTEVSLLEEDIRDVRSDLQSQLRTREAQRSDLALQLRRQKTMNQDIQARIAKLQEQRVPQAGEVEIDAVLLEMAAQLKDDIRSSIPYRHQERLKSVDEVLLARESNKLSAMQAATRLWAVAEDEDRLNREHQLDSLTINVGGKDMLVDIVRLGMMAMFYQSSDGKIGVWSPKSGWVSYSERLQDFEILFRQFRKGIRAGKFSIPLILEGL